MSLTLQSWPLEKTHCRKSRPDSSRRERQLLRGYDIPLFPTIDVHKKETESQSSGNRNDVAARYPPSFLFSFTPFLFLFLRGRERKSNGGGKR